MSLRDQLLKSGLANKQQAKKAEKESKKRQHQQLAAQKDEPSAALKDEISQEIEEKQRQQRERDRELNRQQEEEKRQREALARAIDIMIHHDLKEYRASVPYYYRYRETQIGCIMVNEMQQSLLAQGRMGLVSFDLDYCVYLVDAEQCEKIRACDPSFVVCQHEEEAS
jgi:uncharacterized protein YaiL (DUF2058 family)